VVDGLYILLLSPLIASVVYVIAVAASMVRLSRSRQTHPFVWPAVAGAVTPQLAVYPLMFQPSYLGSPFGTACLIWVTAGLFCIAGLVNPPPPARRWMFFGGIGEIGVSMLLYVLFTAVGDSFGRMH